MGAKPITCYNTTTGGIVQAAQWDGTVDHATEIINWVLLSPHTAMRYLCEPGQCKQDKKDGTNSHYLRLDAPEPTDDIFPGDWIIMDDLGQFTGVDKGDFDKEHSLLQQCEGTESVPGGYFNGYLEPPERCPEPAVFGETLCTHHLGDNSDNIDDKRKDSTS